MLPVYEFLHDNLHYMLVILDMNLLNKYIL